MSLNVSGSKYVTVFNPIIDLDKSENVVQAKLSTYKKNIDRDGNVTYSYMQWYGRFVGEAFEPAKALRNGDKININSGIIENFKSENTDKVYTTVTVFDFEVIINDDPEHNADQDIEII